MFQFLILILFALEATMAQDNPWIDQIVNYKIKTKGTTKILTTNTGAPVEYRDADSTLNTNIMTNEYFIENIAHLNREPIPNRVVHMKGTGAFGYFETTADFSNICKAELFSKVGKQTPVAVRFSMLGTDKGGSDLTREARGYAVKFYTKEGNWDIVGFNTPMFAFRNPSLFVTSVHSVKINPATGFKDPNTFWDFLTLHPETFNMLLTIFGDGGIPDGFRHMSGHSIHTYQVYNKHGTRSFCRFHFYPEAGLKNLNSSEAARLGALDPDYSAKDLYNAIAKGNFPSWKLSAQCLSEKDVKKAKIDVFDLAVIIPESMYPWKEIGTLYLNKNPTNVFAEIEQLALCPGNLVPGIHGAPDKIFETRRFAYRDAQRYRLGANFDKISVNCPYRSQANTYNRDGVAPVNDNEKDAPNYYPNSFNGPIPYEDKNRPNLITIYEKKSANIDQTREQYMNMSTDARSRFVANILAVLCPAEQFLQDRVIKLFTDIDSDLGNRMTEALELNNCKQ